MSKTSAFSIIFSILTIFSMEYIEGTDYNGFDVYGYMEVDDVNAVDGFVERPDGNIIFLDDAPQDDVDTFGQEPQYENDPNFFDQQYEINLEE